MTKDILRHRTRAVVALVGLLLVAGCAATKSNKASVAPAAAPKVAAPKAVAPAVKEPASAAELLRHMAGFLAAARRFSVDVQAQFDVLQASGQMIEFGESRSLTVSRPDHFRIEAEQSDGDRNMVLYDGKLLTAYSPGQNVYAQAAQTGGIDAAVEFFLRHLRMRMPLALLLRSDLPTELDRRTGDVEYVEKTHVDGRSAHHLAGRTDTVDYQFWIADGPEPLPLRIVLTYKTAEGAPQFRAQFANWDLTPTVADGSFAFQPPDGARKIAFLAELADAQRQPTRLPETSGARP